MMTAIATRLTATGQYRAYENAAATAPAVGGISVARTCTTTRSANGGSNVAPEIVLAQGAETN